MHIKVKCENSFTFSFASEILFSHPKIEKMLSDVDVFLNTHVHMHIAQASPLILKKICEIFSAVARVQLQFYSLFSVFLVSPKDYYFLFICLCPTALDFLLKTNSRQSVHTGIASRKSNEIYQTIYIYFVLFYFHLNSLKFKLDIRCTHHKIYFLIC